jgi:hypothetical protein
VEYTISGSIRSASLEVVGGETVALSSQSGKWVGPPASEIPAGTQVIVHATNTSSQTAQTQAFPYLTQMHPVTACGASPPPPPPPPPPQDAGVTDSGTPDSGTQDAGTQDAGACSGSFTPTSWSEGDGANEWWVEYAIGGATVASAYLEVVGRGTVTLSSASTKWVGLSDFDIPAGTSVVVHAQNTAGKMAQTKPFAYLSVTTPQTQPCTP